MKDRLTTVLEFTLPEGTKGFMVYYDACPVGYDCVLMQHRMIFTYVSRKLKVHEKNYLTHNLELADVVFLLNIWMHFLYGDHVYVHKTTRVFNMFLLKRS